MKAEDALGRMVRAEQITANEWKWMMKIALDNQFEIISV